MYNLSKRVLMKTPELAARIHVYRARCKYDSIVITGACSDTINIGTETARKKAISAGIYVEF